MEGKIFATEFKNNSKTMSELYEENFVEGYDRGETFIALTKEKYDSEDEDNPFKFRMYIECVYCEGAWFYTLGLVVCKESFCKEILDKIMSFAGVGFEDLTESDIVDYGFGITFATEKIDVKDDDDEYPSIDMDIVYKIANVETTFRCLRGFFLDKAWNAIGTNGWDTIDECINGTDQFKKSLERIKG